MSVVLMGNPLQNAGALARDAASLFRWDGDGKAMVMARPW
jgi:hypothetical protein